MGLNFSNSNVYFGYGTFNIYRVRLAIATNILPYPYRSLNDIKINEIQHEPLRDFIYHSDCDGELSVKQLKEIAPRLKELAVIFKRETDGIFYEKTLELVKDMEWHIKKNKSLIFC